MEHVKQHTACRLCAGPLYQIMDYGKMPPANALADTKDEAWLTPKYEQKLLFCPACLLGQLSVVVDPAVLYKDYVYRSSASPVFKEHCAELAQRINTRLGGTGAANPVVVDIAGNDGTLAREIKQACPAAQVFVVDPAQDDAETPWTKIRSFWNENTAGEFIVMHGRADVITAQNVIGHVDDIQGFFRAARSALSPDGVFIVEIPSFVELVKRGAFDTVYHEHVSYWTESALYKLAAMTGFQVLISSLRDIHCGSFRLWLVPVLSAYTGTVSPVEQDFLNDALPDFAEDALRRVSVLRDLLYDGNSSDLTVIGVTAGAKSSVLLNLMIDAPIDYLVDDTPGKQGKFSPGTGVPVRPFDSEHVKDADAAVILSRNLETQLIEKLRKLGFRGTVVSP